MITTTGSIVNQYSRAGIVKCVFFYTERSKSPAGPGGSETLERKIMLDKHPKNGRVSQAGAFAC